MWGVCKSNKEYKLDILILEFSGYTNLIRLRDWQEWDCTKQ